MKLLQIGAPKSGNFWLYKILDGILKRVNLSKPHFIQQQPIFELAKNWDLNYPEQAGIDVIDITDLQCFYRISSIFKMPITDLRQYISRTNHVWTHSPICKSSGKVFSLFDKKIYIIRDPRDRAVSASNYYCSSYMQKYFPQPIATPQDYLKQHLEDLMIEWVWHVFDHLRLKEKLDIHLVFYEAFTADFDKELNSLLDYLELELFFDEKQRLKQKVSFTTLKKSNPKHLRKGTSGYWKNHFSEEQEEKANLLTAPLLKLLRYSSPPESGDFNFPEFFDIDFISSREELIEAQRF